MENLASLTEDEDDKEPGSKRKDAGNRSLLRFNGDSVTSRKAVSPRRPLLSPGSSPVGVALASSSSCDSTCDATFGTKCCALSVDSLVPLPFKLGAGMKGDTLTHREVCHTDTVWIQRMMK